MKTLLRSPLILLATLAMVALLFLFPVAMALGLWFDKAGHEPVWDAYTNLLAKLSSWSY